MKTLSDRKLVHYKRILFKEIPTVISLHPPVANLLVLFGDTLHTYTLCPNYIYYFRQIFPKYPWQNYLKTADSQASLTAISRMFKQIFWEMLLKCKI